MTLLCFVAGAVLHYEELGELAVALLTTLIVGLLWVIRRPRLNVNRTIEPNRVTKGDLALGLVTVTNESNHAISATYAVEHIGEERLEVSVPGLAARATTRVTYRLPTDRRAVVNVGPLSVGRRDPFQVCRSMLAMGGVEHAWVHPISHVLSAVPIGRTRSLDGSDDDRLAHGSITFHTLREYVPGDDLRHVHWRSTARVGQLMVREHVDTTTPQLVLVLDTSTESYNADEFEEAVEAAASIVALTAKVAFPIQLITSGGRSATGRGIAEDARSIFDVLAEVDQNHPGSLASTVLGLTHRRRGDVFVVITGRPADEDLIAIGAVTHRFDRGIVGIVHPEATEISFRVSEHTRIVRGRTGAQFADAWNLAVER